MTTILTHLAKLIAASPAHDQALHLLRTIPGLPPIVQTLHILSVSAVIASIVFISLRVLGIALPSQHPKEMVKRLAPWLWTALPLLFLSGAIFIIARPMRYATNPVFVGKLIFLLVALVMSVILIKQINAQVDNSPTGLPMKVCAAFALFFWIMTMLAGRWIAYADYLFNPA